jgi:site-specific DNA-methyltransferase (cytosine-N4-specific)
VKTKTASRKHPASTAYRTDAGAVYVGKAEEALAKPPLTDHRGQVQLLFTSPPFPLVREKKYGNLQGDAFARWLSGYAQLFADYLTPNGSIVMELGNGWTQGQPTMSTASLKAFLAFQEAANLHLCQEFICYNPARLPTPAEWVTVRRVRVKDSFTRVWWLSPNPHPKADNRRVLTEYSDSMRKLLKRGTYTGGKRPSEHHIGPRSFLQNNGGAIPPNVLIPPNADHLELQSVLSIANTASNNSYNRLCRERELKKHPAVMPEQLVEFFVQFLTDPGDLVLDPFAGSNTTGAVAERLGRRWLAVEADAEYAAASQVRFEKKAA